MTKQTMNLSFSIKKKKTTKNQTKIIHSGLWAGLTHSHFKSFEPEVVKGSFAHQ